MMNFNLLLRSLLLLTLASCARAAAFTIVSPVRTPTCTTGTTTSSFLRPLSAVARGFVRRKTSSISTKTTTTTTTTALQAVVGGLLWDRLEIEEDDEPHWYLLNCVATNELILLQQCRQVCKDMSPLDVVKFIVPTERKMTRSHGPNKMVTETKVKYQGYVFAKLRLCARVYEALQGLDLCRSWMGTVNHKGYRKLPPAPLALSETEIANFGLEDYQEDEEDTNDDEYGDDKPDEDNVIVDEAKESVDESDENASKSKKNTKENSSKHALKVYLGLKVDDMIKVTSKGKFFNEDGIVRRLKDGKLLVRFYTYGSLWEEWLDPSEVRKLDNMEILKGLSGPSQPVTQRDFDDPENSGDDAGGGGRDRGGGYGQERTGSNDRFGGAFGGAGGPPQLQERNRRQDRTEQRFRSTRNRNDLDQQDNRNDSNWNWYKDNQSQPSQQQQGQQPRQQWDRSPSPGQRQDDNNNNGSSWGRPPPPPPRRQEYGGRQQQQQQQWDRPPPRRQQDRNDNRGSSDSRRANQSTDKAIRGEDDWSAFVSSPSTSSRKSSGGGGAEDDFFQSLLNDLSDDLQKAASQRSSSQQEPQQQQQRQQRQPSSGGTSFSSSSDSASVEDDFFASLLSEVNEKENQRPSAPAPTPPARRPAPAAKQASRSSSEEDDFFASLLSQVSGDVAKASSSAAATTPKTTRSSVSKNDKEKYNADYADELFAELTADIAPHKQSKKGSQEDSFFDDLQAELRDTTTATASPPKGRAKATSAESSAAAAPPRSSSSSSSDDLNKRTVPALKEMLREKGLKVSGNKAELVERLQNS